MIGHEFSQRILTRCAAALERACMDLPNGGSNDTRQYIALRLLEATICGLSEFDELVAVALKAVSDLPV